MTTSVSAPERASVAGPGRRSLFLVGAAAIFFPLVYLVSDLVEVVQGDFTVFRLTLTYVGEAGFPLFVVGLCALLRDRLSWWGLVGGIASEQTAVIRPPDPTTPVAPTPAIHFR